MKMFNDDVPIYLQLRRHIEDLILDRVLSEEDSIPSLRVMAKDYRLNPITISNALSALVDEDILYKKRGLGIYVSQGARRKIIEARRGSFEEEELKPALKRARQLEIQQNDLIELIEEVYGGDHD